MRKTCYVCGGHIRPGGNHFVVVIGETRQRPKAARHINCYPGSVKYMKNPDLAASYLEQQRIGLIAVGSTLENRKEKVLNIWTGDVSIRTKKATESETCGCGQPLFTLADGKSKGCPSCGEQY